MGGKNRKQSIEMDVKEGSIPLLPKGSYVVYIDSTGVRKGSIVFAGRVLSTLGPIPPIEGGISNEEKG